MSPTPRRIGPTPSPTPWRIHEKAFASFSSHVITPFLVSNLAPLALPAFGDPRHGLGQSYSKMSQSFFPDADRIRTEPSARPKTSASRILKS